ncbi:hypothetical protein GCM10008018_63510 [Paenibacillus marchantiophytorum]|uniref:Uncharacterized protein n=1 Tax=Paenibacillus marchantiophytorum TaxID=1619310 RepID=A0ABQ1FFC6_9BACL|nr:hypothetical protein [Paenibacillus marchantiophytorum]GGA09204.1 hypothetical protein GCM10008018_63510 [Paenibacillus marchantiophytorum]
MYENLDDFLQRMDELEDEVNQLILQSNLTAAEKKFIFDHILVIPRKMEEPEAGKAIS